MELLMSWIKKSIQESSSLKDHYKLHHINIFIKDKFPKHLDFDRCVHLISRMLSPHLLKGIDIIYVGEFGFLDEMDFSALFKDGAIYLSNKFDDEDQIIEDLVHEIAHSNEYLYSDILYSDGAIMKEFLGKRKKLFYILKSENLSPPQSLQTNVEFDKDIDEYLYKTVGYPMLNALCNGLFISAYSTTSIREYFSTAFAEYFQGDKKSLKNTCPIVFSKIEELIQLEG